MGQSNGTARNEPREQMEGVIVTCDHCRTPLILLVATDGKPPGALCPMCRVYYSLAQVLSAMQRKLRRPRPPAS